MEQYRAILSSEDAEAPKNGSDKRNGLPAENLEPVSGGCRTRVSHVYCPDDDCSCDSHHGSEREQDDQMRYTLDSAITLKRWQGSPPYYLVGKGRKLHPLTEEEDGFLRRCDGQSELPEGFLADRLQASGMIHPCPENTGSPSGRMFTYPNIHVDNIDWNITDRCNYNCRHCFHAADNSFPRDEFSLEEAKCFLDDVVTCGISSLRLTGGEPTLHPHIREILTLMREKGIRLATLITNGSRLDGDFLSFLKAMHPGAEIMISFDGLSTHDWMRQHPGSEEVALDAIRRSKAAGFRVAVNCNANRKNRSVLIDTVDCLAGENVDMIRVIRTSEAPRWELNHDNMTLTPEEYYELSLELARHYLTSGITAPLIIWQSLYLNGKRRVFACLPVKGAACGFTGKELICSAMLKKPSVLANGEITPCTPMAGYFALHGIHMENVKTVGLQQAMTSGVFVSAVTARAGEKLLNNAKCGECAYGKSCRGGCPALSIASGGDMMSSDETKCAFFYGGYYEKYCGLMKDWKNLNPV